jgi:predicted RNA-binding protein with PUA-like domain
MAYWLFKSEPEAWSWDQQVAKKGPEPWNGVRNHQAANNMKAMKKGDRGFFYHSGKERRIVGTVEVVREAYPDHTDPTGRFVMVDVAAREPFVTPVTLEQAKADRSLADMTLVKFSRLSVQPVSPAHWQIVCRMGGVKP